MKRGPSGLVHGWYGVRACLWHTFFFLPLSGILSAPQVPGANSLLPPFENPAVGKGSDSFHVYSSVSGGNLTRSIVCACKKGQRPSEHCKDTSRGPPPEPHPHAFSMQSNGEWFSGGTRT